MITIIVPIYNEQENLEVFIKNMDNFLSENSHFRAILVNDGSTDNTISLLKEIKNKDIRVISHKKNKGAGAAIKSGILNCQTKYCITMDADGQHHFDDILHVAEFGVNNKFDLVVGERKSHKISGFYRNTGKFIIRNLAFLLLRKNLRDLNSGMRFFLTKMIKNYVDVLPDRFAFHEISTILFLYQKEMIGFVPITVYPRERGISTINTMTAIDVLREVINIFMLFSPLRIFLPISVLSIIIGIIWAIPYIYLGRGLSVGALLLILIGAQILFFGILAEQISKIRKLLHKID